MCCQSNVPHTCHTHLDESVSNQVCLQLMSCSVSSACTQCECSNNFAQQVFSNHSHFSFTGRITMRKNTNPQDLAARGLLRLIPLTPAGTQRAALCAAQVQPKLLAGLWLSAVAATLLASLTVAPSVTLFPFVPILPQGHSHKQKSLKFIQIH